MTKNNINEIIDYIYELKEKDNPRSIDEYYYNGQYHYGCPKCKKELLSPIEETEFCYHCGQALTDQPISDG